MKNIISFLILTILIISNVTAFSTLSLDQIDFSENGDEFQRQWFLLISQDDTSDYASLTTFDNSEINSDGQTAKYDTTISTNIIKRSCDYDIISDNIKILRTNLESKNRFFWWQDDDEEQSCMNRGGIYFIAEDLGYYCIIGTTESIKGSFNDKTFNVEDKIIVTSKGQSRSVKISNTNPTATTNDLVARWQGNLVSGRDCPDIDERIPIYNQNNGEWQLTSRTAYNQYVSYHTSGMESCVTNAKNKAFTGFEDFKKCVNDYNFFTDNVMSPRTFQISSSQGIIDTSTSTNGRLIVNKVDLLQFPIISMKINADWIGIIQPQTEPEITSLKTDCFTQGDIGFIEATIRNNGGSGSVSLTTECDLPLRAVQGTIIRQIDSGKSIDVQLQITGASLEEQQQKCKVTVKDRSNPGIQDSREVIACMQPVVLCNEGTLRCNGNLIQECNSEGSGYNILQSCANECVIDDGEPTCQTVNECTSDVECNEGESCINSLCVADNCNGLCEYECKQQYPVTDVAGRLGCIQKCKIKCHFLDNLQIYIITLSVLIAGGILTTVLIQRKPKKKGRK